MEPTATPAAPAPTDAATAPDGVEASEIKPTETVDFWKSKAREQEKRAKANAEAAAKLAELEESQKSEAQRQAEATAAAQQEAAEARAEALRWRIAAKHGISDEDAETFLTGTDEETLIRQAERLAALATATTTTSTTPTPAPRPDLSQGARDLPLNGDPIEQALRDHLGIR